jgi:hypothetical protein
MVHGSGVNVLNYDTFNVLTIYTTGNYAGKFVTELEVKIYN